MKRKTENPACVDAQAGHQMKINGKAGLPVKNKGRALTKQVFRVLLLIETALMAASLCLLALEIILVIGGIA